MVRALPGRIGDRAGRIQLGVAIGTLMLALVAIVPHSARASIVMSGTRDDAGVTAPRWGAENYTASTTGAAAITLDWQGDGNLAISLRNAATRQWLAADTSTDRPKVISYDLVAGTTYRIAVWAMSGSGTFTVDLDDGGDPPPTSTTQPGGVQTQCGISNGFDLCLHVADATLTGHADVWVTFNGPNDVFALEYAWGTGPTATDDLLTDFYPPWSWSWPTHRYLDATGYLVVRAEKPAGTTGAPIAIPVTLANGNTAGTPQNPLDWQSRFAPRAQQGADPVIAAVGDGGDGGPTSDALAAALETSDAELVLYLGDMYERGTPAEWEVNFGLASFDDPGGGTSWGRLAGFTQPTLGNHEAWHPDVWRDYWHGRPDWNTFTYGGVRFLNLNSECGLVGGCDPGSPQYEFARAVVETTTEACIVAMWHRPVISAVSNATAMEPLWDLIADHGGDLVLTGHTHDMEATRPLNGTLQAGAPDSHMVQLVSGAGGHNMVSKQATDPRTMWQATKVAGAAFLTLIDGDDGDATAISWAFRDAAGDVVTAGGALGTGRVECGAPAEPDIEPPTRPGRPSGTSPAPGKIELTWGASTDDRATTLTYLVHRDDQPSPIGSVASSSTTTVGFTDVGLTAGDVHTYTVTASDGKNTSEASSPSDPITVRGPDPGDWEFSDDFGDGLGKWSTASGVVLDQAIGGAAPPAARMEATGERAYLATDVDGRPTALCLGAAVRVDDQSGTISLLRIRSANGLLVRVYRRANGALWLRNDLTGQQTGSGAALPTATWAALRLCVDTVAGTLALDVDGAQAAVWNTDTAGTATTTIQLGDSGVKTWVGWFDDVIATTP